ncbi:hypothetical protein [Larkinella arboricola]
MAQSIQNPKSDSLTVVRDWVGLAKPMLDSLTKLHFIRKDVAALQLKLLLAERQRDGLAVELKKAYQDNSQLANELFEAKDQLGLQKQKNRQAQLERWLWRVGAAAGLYLKLKPLL